MRPIAAALALALIVGLSAVHADPWDEGPDNDDTTSSDNELVHGLSQQHDLGVRPGPTADLDFYPLLAPAYTSHEITIDGTTGAVDLASGNRVVRLAQDGITILQSGTAVSLGDRAVTMTWMIDAPAPLVNYIRIGPAVCLLTCTSNDRYTIRYRDTTIGVPRFNNAGSQITVLMIQNTDRVPVDGSMQFWTPAGTLIAAVPFSIPFHGLLVYPTQTTAPGASGSITITSTAHYGTLAAKAVALEPATGFSFDTIGAYKPY